MKIFAHLFEALVIQSIIYIKHIHYFFGVGKTAPIAALMDDS